MKKKKKGRPILLAQCLKKITMLFLYYRKFLDLYEIPVILTSLREKDKLLLSKVYNHLVI